ncbi:hypothetical protein SDC9_55750 [bioreactor metagenome]|uniref:Aminopeptidase N n=1 Tax=bioreactor metagenome TaxID=1076179 RepID=A0A644X562_9ZZZZ
MNKLLCLLSLIVCTFVLRAQNIDINSTKQIALDEAFKASRMHDVPEKFVGQEYDLKYHRFNWTVDPASNYISGSVTSYFVAVQNNLSQIDFSLKDNMWVDSVKYHGSPAMSVHVSNEVRITGFPAIASGTLDSITVYYHGAPQATSGFISFVTSTHGSGTPALWTLSEPYGAYEWWPCKNDLSDKIDSIDVYVTHPNGYHAGSNGLLISETVGASETTAHWKHRYPIAAYLIAIAVTNYTIFTDTFTISQGTLPVVNYAYPENVGDAQWYVAGLEPVMQFYDSLIAPYPYMNEKYGHAEFGWGGGMEHQTMTFLGGYSYELLAHELLHQWFGDAVTCGSWQDIWLNEGFATYFTALNYEHFFPNQWWMPWKEGAVNYITSQPDGSVFVYDTTDVDRVFSSRLSYYKGAYVLHMLRWVVGDDHFFQGCRNYFTDPSFYFGYAKTPDFIAHMEAESGMDLTEFFNDWIYNEGYPSYTVVVDPISLDSISITLSQVQSHSSVSFFEMPVPVTLFKGGQDTTFVLNNSFSGQEFHVAFSGGQPDSVLFDKDLHLLSAYNTVVVESGLKDQKMPEISIFPNPVADVLHVNGADQVSAIYIIIDNQGKTVSRLSGCKNGNIPVHELAPGVYSIRIEAKDWTYTSSFVKE